MKVKVIGEIGINHNGSLELTKKLIDVAIVAGCDFVKFQKRNPDVCVPDKQKNKPKSTPWGEMTYLEYKYKTEFGKEEYDEIDKYCKDRNIGWFASVWDKDSVDFMSNYSIDGKVIMKIPSALITDDELIKYARLKSDYLMISTGMSYEDEIMHCVDICNPDLIFHTNSTYPSPVKELNLGYIKWLKHNYTDVEIGYSGHEFGLVTTYGAVMLGATWIERHITLDRTMWGSDQMASVEPTGLIKLIKGIRDLEISTITGNGPRKVIDSELSKRKSLRGV
jgi:N-acetylneuraminate synthase